jgi:hypothetical protein
MDKYKDLLLHDAVEIEDIPNIDLYMDQVTGYMEKTLDKQKVDPEDKILTKTMINNYVKAKIIDKPSKKKYSKNHLMELIMIYHLKNIISIGDIDDLLKFEKERLISKDNKVDDANNDVNYSEEVYQVFLRVQKQVIEDARSTFNEFKDKDSENKKIEEIFSLILEADLKKRVAELLINDLIVNEKE